MNSIVNRVDQSGIVTLDLGQYYPKLPLAGIDLKDWLFKGLILKEKDFREAIKKHDWHTYKGRAVYVFCTTDAIIPVWAWMLIQTALSGNAEEVITGTKDDMLLHLFRQNLQQSIKIADFKDKPVVIKGCGDKPVPPGVFMEAVKLLIPLARSVMYGEPCSTVPVYKKPALRKATQTSRKS